MTKITYKQWGGKSSIAKWVVSHFPNHLVYVEPFCGSCAVLFSKPKSRVETVNDLDDRIVNMYEQIRSRPKELAALLWATPYSKVNWQDARVKDDKLEDARLLMAESIQYYCGNRNTSTWRAAWNVGGNYAEVWADWFLRILPAAARLKTVQVLNEDALEVIKRVSQDEDTLIYADPPYVGHECEYAFAVDYQAMVDVLNEAKAKVVVSECLEAAPFWNGWRMVQREFTGTAGAGVSGKSKTKTEVLYMNYEFKKKGFGL